MIKWKERKTKNHKDEEGEEDKNDELAVIT